MLLEVGSTTLLKSGLTYHLADALPRVTPLIIEDPVIEKEILAVNIVSNSPIKEKEKNILKTAIKYDIE